MKFRQYLNILLLLSLPVKAQYMPDAQAWCGIGLNQNLPGPFSWSMQYQQRFDQNISNLKGHYSFFNLGWKISKNINTILEYRNVIKSDGNFHRFSSETTFRKKINSWTISNRVILQNEYPYFSKVYEPGNEPTLVFRNRIQCRYELNSHTECFVSLEPFLDIDDDPDWNRIRYIIGIQREITKKINVNLFYLMQHSTNGFPATVDHVYGLMASYELPKWKGAKKKSKKEVKPKDEGK